MLGYNRQQFYYLFNPFLEFIIFKRVSQVYRKLFHSQIADKTSTQSTNNQQLVNAPISTVTIIPRSGHNVSRQLISENALKVLYRLNKQGYDAYLVGGCVRDILLGMKPKDFDIATNATPEQVQKSFRNCRLVGRRFRLAHIMFGREIIEVATFRGNHTEQNEHHDKAKRSQTGMLLRDNVYGTIEQDAIRRDFRINALYYSVKDFSIRDYCNGIEDLRRGIIRLIGDPTVRYQEDPVRILRAIRFSAKLKMKLDHATAAPIKQLTPLLKNIPGPRLFDESLKLLQSGYGYQTYLLLRKYGLFSLLFPAISRLLPDSKNDSQTSLSYVEKMIEQTLKNTDYRINNKQRVNPAFLFSAILWYPLCEHTQTLRLESGLSYNDAFNLSIHDILSEQCSVLSIPKRLTAIMCDIWHLQFRLNRRTSIKRIDAVFEHIKFRAGYDLLELRSGIEKGKLLELTRWWDEYQHADSDQKTIMAEHAIHCEKNQQRKYKKPFAKSAQNKR